MEKLNFLRRLVRTKALGSTCAPRKHGAFPHKLGSDTV